MNIEKTIEENLDIQDEIVRQTVRFMNWTLEYEALTGHSYLDDLDDPE